MVFSSIPLYLDPHNWHQQQNQHHRYQGIGSTGNTTQAQILPSPPPPLPQLNGGGGGGLGSIRPASMVDRARQAKLPQPEPGLNCPRCDSTNTKFCYFNNYNLTQPRHFCKTCRRYWTRGGALRNVPVGGGCRKNKRSTKNNRATSSGNTIVKSSSSITSTTPSNYSTEVNPTNFSQLPIIPSLDNLGNNNSSTGQFGTSSLGLSFGATQRESDLVFIQLGSNNNNNSREVNCSIIPDQQWRNSQHFPFMTSFEPNASSSSMYQLFQNDHQNVAEAPSLMKVEDQNQLGLNLRKPLLLDDSQNNNQQYNWGISGGNSTWNDFSAAAGGNPNSSSPSHNHLL